MMNKSSKSILLVLGVVMVLNSFAQCGNHEVKIIGRMKDVMWNGQLYGNIYLDTISNKSNLYGMGPVEYLKGEILVIGGKSYTSSVVSDTRMKVEETYKLKAPFFAYSHIEKWKEIMLPDSIKTIKNLETFLWHYAPDCPGPFMFKLIGRVESAEIHVVNLPKEATVSSPKEAHRGKINYHLRETESEIIGFFSTRHQGVFTHHSSFLHMHLITADRKKMGHLDEASFSRAGMKLYLPVYNK